MPGSVASTSSIQEEEHVIFKSPPTSPMSPSFSPGARERHALERHGALKGSRPRRSGSSPQHDKAMVDNLVLEKDVQRSTEIQSAKARGVKHEKNRSESSKAQDTRKSSSKGDELILTIREKKSAKKQPTHQHTTGFRRLVVAFGGGTEEEREDVRQTKIAELDDSMLQRWGVPGGMTRELIMRYWRTTRTEEHWLSLREKHPRQFRTYLDKGYMEPIPVDWVQDQRLAIPYPDGSQFETPAEKRLYYLLNNATMPDGSKSPPLQPLNIIYDRLAIVARGNARNARAEWLDSDRIAAYSSPADVFRSNRRVQSLEYSPQVPATVYAARRKALEELADGLLRGTDQLETMLLLDVSSSMKWDPHEGVFGPDGVVRYHDQPANIELVRSLVQRSLKHMVPRARKYHPNQQGIDTVTFADQGRYIGQLSASKFASQWKAKVRLGGGTRIMRGWQVVKSTYFERMHREGGHGYFHPIFGWQWTPGMPKLSLLIFLDGEAQDMAEFELELLGETWAYITVALVGMEACPHHHSHAIELDRVTRFNPHIAFVEVHGRVCERLFVEDLLKSVYPVDPPTCEEILKPEFDLKVQDLAV